MALEVDDGGLLAVILFGLLLLLALLLRAEHRGHGGWLWCAVGRRRRRAQRLPLPVGGFADDEASTACARCRLSRRYGGAAGF